MKNVEFSEGHLAEMRQFYSEELDKTVKRLQHIKSVLEQLGDNSTSISIQIASSKQKSTTEATTTGESTTTTGARKRPGRKSMWEGLIVKRLRQLDRPVTYDELTDEIMLFSKLPEEKRINTKQAIVNVIFRMRGRNEKLDTFSIGSREKYIALKQWFESPGEIKKEYRDKIKNPKRTIKYKKRKTKAS